MEAVSSVPETIAAAAASASCDAPADCPYAADDDRFDDDNYACEDSLCEWVGCQSDAECKLNGPNWECVEL